MPSALGMRLLTYTFVALVVPLAAVTRGQPGARRALWAAALAIFAVSALHLSQLHQGDASWPVELVGHHASLPLAFAILYQDYPFALADLFLKRALALLGIVALAFAAIAVFGAGPTAFAAVRARRSTAGWRAGDAVGRHGAALSRASASHRVVRRHDRARVGRTTARCERPSRGGADARRRRGAARRRLRAAGAGPQREPVVLARVARRGSTTLAVDGRHGRRAGGRFVRPARLAWRMPTTSTRSSWRPSSSCRRAKRRDMPSSSRQLTGGRRLLSDDVGDTRGDRCRGGPPDRRDPDHARALRARASRAGDRQARDRSGAASAARPDQSAFPLQRADDDRLPHPDRAAAGAGDA